MTLEEIYKKGKTVLGYTYIDPSYPEKCVRLKGTSNQAIIKTKDKNYPYFVRSYIRFEYLPEEKI